jgi:hypothetical protein
MASSRWVCHGPAKCLQTNDFRRARPRAGVPRIVRRYRGFRQGTDNERSLALGGSAGSRVAVESASASIVREPDSCCSSWTRPRPTDPAAHRGCGSTSACPQEQQRQASRFSAGRHLSLVQRECPHGLAGHPCIHGECGGAGSISPASRWGSAEDAWPSIEGVPRVSDGLWSRDGIRTSEEQHGSVQRQRRVARGRSARR